MHVTKITVSDVEGDVNYEELMKEFGIKRIGELIEKLGKKVKLPALYRRGVVFAHRDFDVIVDAIVNKKRFAVLTGANPSGRLHFGNKMFLDQALFLQKMGADVFIPISNDETYVFRKSASLEDATKNALENVIPSIIALGFDPKKTHIFISTQERRIYELAIRLSTKTTFSTLKAIFGFSNDTNPGQIFYAVVQSAHILLPQLKEFSFDRTVVPIGIDQDPYMRLARDIAEKSGFAKPSSTYHKFLSGLQGGKMSGSKPETCIFLDDSREDAKKKIMKALTGGGGSKEEHMKKGGSSDVCSVFEYLSYMIEDDEKLAEMKKQCSLGSRMCGECKHDCVNVILDFLEDHRKKKEDAKKHIDKFMLK